VPNVRTDSTFFFRLCGACAALAALTACGTTSHFVDQPHLMINEPSKDPRQAVNELFQLTPPYNVSLCEADPSSKECTKANAGVTAKGVGGIFLPLVLEVRGMSIEKQMPSADGVSFKASLDAKVDALSPHCGTVGGRVVVRENNTASVQLRHFYCNWAVIGNVLVNADFSVDSIDLKERVVTGFYKLTFHGTGNAAGSGYYRAVIVPASASDTAAAKSQDLSQLKESTMHPIAPLLLVSSLCCATASAGDLTVRVEHVRSDHGAILAALYENEASFMNPAKARATFKVKAVTGEVQYVFHDLPAGKYALSTFHDENGNGQLDRNLVGLPKEGYGFSNSKGSLRPPRFSQAAFDFDGTSKSITITLNY